MISLQKIRMAKESGMHRKFVLISALLLAVLGGCHSAWHKAGLALPPPGWFICRQAARRYGCDSRIPLWCRTGLPAEQKTGV